MEQDAESEAFKKRFVAVIVIAHLLNWEYAYAKGYKIQVSNDATSWTDVYATVNGDGGIDDIYFEPVNTRYVRVYATDRGTGYWYSLYEFEVYGG